MNATIAIASLLTGAAILAVAYIFSEMFTQRRDIGAATSRFEFERRERLRAADPMYRRFEPWIDELGASFNSRHPERVERLGKDWIGAGEADPWLPQELLAACQIKSFGFALGAGLLALPLLGPLGVALSMVVAYWVGGRLLLRSLALKAQRRRLYIKRRLAASLNLLAIMMEVGGNFFESLVAVAADAADHPLGKELARVVVETQAGRSRKDALHEFADRMSDIDVNDFVFAIVKGEELGTPLAKILTNQSEQMRLKRSQWAEKATQEAQVTIVFPAMLIMVACLLLVAAPFLLAGLNA